jgi:hypothetical protein
MVSAVEKEDLMSAAIDRLMKIDWRNLQGAVGATHAGYLSEYFRRAALFLRDNEPSVDLAFFDAAEILCPGQIRLDGRAAACLSSISAVGVGGLVRAICQAHLKLVALASMGGTRAEPYAGLYEPLICIMEAGVDIGGVRKGELIFGAEGYAIPLSGWKKRALPDV